MLVDGTAARAPAWRWHKFWWAPTPWPMVHKKREWFHPMASLWQGDLVLLTFGGGDSLRWAGDGSAPCSTSWVGVRWLPGSFGIQSRWAAAGKSSWISSATSIVAKDGETRWSRHTRVSVLAVENWDDSVGYWKGIRYHLIEGTETNSISCQNRTKRVKYGINLEGGRTSWVSDLAWVNPAGLTVSGVRSGKDPGYREGVAKWAWWVASCTMQKQREGEWKGGDGRAGLGFQLSFGPLSNRSEKILFLFPIFS
jgi:hypothetical protein